jgi:thioredoxin reductase
MEVGAMTTATDRPTGGSYDVVVVGAGAAGLSAGLVLGRTRRPTAVVGAGPTRNARATQINGFLTRDGISPPDFLAMGEAELARYGVTRITDRVLAIDPAGEGGHFQVRLACGSVLMARHILVATGLRDELPPIPGLAERWGIDVLFCPFCDGWEASDQPLGVLGGRPASVEQALLVRQWSEDIIFFPHDKDLTDAEQERLAARGVEVAPGPVARIVTDAGRLTGVELADGRLVSRQVLFTSPRRITQDGLLTALGCDLGKGGTVLVDVAGRTSVPGVWAAGNVVRDHASVIVATSMGAVAAAAVNRDMVREETAAAVEEYRRGAAVRSAE